MSHRPPNTHPSNLVGGSEQNTGILCSRLVEQPPSTPPHSISEKIGSRSAGKAEGELLLIFPLPFPVPMEAPHATSCRLLPPFLSASAAGNLHRKLPPSPAALLASSPETIILGEC